MQCTLLIPHLFWPRVTADAVERGLELPQLRKLLGRAHLDRHSAITPEAWLCQAFEVERQQDWPVAPFTLVLDGGEPGEAYWMRADPVHIKVSREGLHIVDSSLFELGQDEAAALVASLNDHFRGQSLEFHAPRAKRWYVKVAKPPALQTDPIAEVAGKDVERHLPRGADALAWHRLFNEAQMLLHDHPVNDAREARGEPPVNSVWLWGGGTRAPARGHYFHAVHSDSEIAAALAAAADVHAAPVPSDAAAWIESATGGAPDASHLVMLDMLRSAVTYEDGDAWRTRIAALEAHWIAPLVRAVATGRLKELVLVTLGEAESLRFTLHRADLLKVWRPARALSVFS